MKKLKVSTPGRICLFGEHQDYLGLPVIAAAINRRIAIEGEKSDDNIIRIQLPDINSSEEFELRDQLLYTKKADYFKSSINVLRKNGVEVNSGITCSVRGNIPIKSGTSSSSAMVVSWINFISELFGYKLTKERIGALAYEAEVSEFDEEGGMMDQYSTAIGRMIFLSSFPEIKIEIINAGLGTFVLGDSLQPKDTQGILARVKRMQLESIREVKLTNDFFDLQNVKSDDIFTYEKFVNKEYLRTLRGTVENRIITYEAKKLLESIGNNSGNDFTDEKHKEFGRLLTKEHEILSGILGISTPKIEKMISAAIEAGAYGAKINGSGGGGCMFAYAPENPETVAEAIELQGGKACLISIDEGTEVEYSE